MAKERTKTKNGPKNEETSQLEVMFEVGNYAAIRRLAKSHPDAATAQILKTMGPEPLVFWIGVGSVAVATALALWLVL